MILRSIRTELGYFHISEKPVRSSNSFTLVSHNELCCVDFFQVVHHTAVRG